MYYFSNLEPVHCSMSSSNCCFYTCIQISQEAGHVVWYSHLFQNFPQFVVIHTVKGFGIVNKAEIDVFLELSCFFDNPVYIGNLIPGSLVAYWAPTGLGSSSFSVLSFCLFILFMGFSRQEYWSGFPFPSPVEHVLSELSTMTPLSQVALHGMAHSFIELDKTVVHAIRLDSFLWLWF